MTKTLRYGAIAAIAAIPAVGAREKAEPVELGLANRVGACVDMYGRRVEQAGVETAEIVTLLGCSAMESCQTGQTTHEVAHELSLGDSELAPVAQRALPLAEDLIGSLDLRRCVEMEIVAPEGSDQPQYSQHIKGLVPEIFYGEN